MKDDEQHRVDKPNLLSWARQALLDGSQSALVWRIVATMSFPVLLLVTDFTLRLTTLGNANPRRWTGQDLGVYSLGIVWSLGTWWLLTLLIGRVFNLGRLRTGIAFGISLLVTVLAMVSFAYRGYFDQSPSWQVLRMAIAESNVLWITATWALGAHHFLFVAVFVLLGLWSFTWAGLRARIPRSWLGRAFGVIGVAAWVTNGVFTLGVAGFQDPLPVDTNAAAAVVQYGLAMSIDKKHLVAPTRPIIPAQPHLERPNLILMVHESLRTDGQFVGMNYMGARDPRPLAPFASRLQDRRSEGYFVFPVARTNSTATESSAPAILSAVDPGGASDAYGHVTSIWSVGKATNAYTFLYSAQDYSFSHFDEFFFDKSVDAQRTGLDFAPVYVNDRGIDDMLAVEAALSDIRKVTSEGKRFVGVVHFNATHRPGFFGPGELHDYGKRDNPRDYDRALRYLDKVVQRLMDGLTDLAVMDQTVVVSTSDHGETIDPHHGVNRLNAFYDETVRIPIWVYVPERWRKENPEWASNMDSWKQLNVQNLDVLPTIVDLLKMGQVTELQNVMVGRSLVRQPPQDNLMVGQSTCAFRAWSHDGFFLVRGQVKVIISNDQNAPQVYDLEADPTESRDLWGDAAWRERVLPWVREALILGEERRAACRRVGSLCPVNVDELGVK